MEYARICEVVRDAKASPRLTPWEKNFIETLARGIAYYGEGVEFTSKQIATLMQIEVKIYASG